ncbi:MAG TPA: hypothetical protein VNT57_07260 [Desulfobacteria bacterium]|nr:hypothetical protein [Desulfobacteria bacterium]
MSGITAKLNSVKFKLGASAYLTTLVVLIATVLVYSHFFEGEQDSLFRNRVISVARTAATLIKSDDFDQLRTKEDEKTESYYHLRKTLQDIKRANPQILFIYTLRKTPERNVYEFVVDADKKPYHIGEKYDISGQDVIRKALKYPVAETEFENNRWGDYLTGYAPIMDPTGKTVGIVGVDFAVSTPEEPKESSRTLAFLTALIITMALTSIFFWKSIVKITQPLSQIHDAINGSTQGSLVQPIAVSSKDEYEDIAAYLNKFSESMNEMQKKLQKEHDSSELNHQKVLNVYSDIIYAATQGKLRLLEGDRAKTLTLEGVLYNEFKLEWNEDIKKSADMAQQLLEEKNFGIVKISQALSCIRESASNTLKHASLGVLQLRVLDDLVRVIISDRGPGIKFDNLPTILFLRSGSGDVSAQCGFPLIIEYADKTFMATSEEGTIIVMDFELKKFK